MTDEELIKRAREMWQWKHGWDSVRRLVRHISAWAWKPVWDAGEVHEVHELHYRHTTRTCGGDVERTACMSSWTTRAEAEEAERKAWREYGWKKLEPKKNGTVTWIEMRPVYSLPNESSSVTAADSAAASAKERN